MTVWGKYRGFCYLLIFITQLIIAGAVLSDTPKNENRSTDKPTEAERIRGEREIWVASNGWHSAIFLARTTIPLGAIPEVADFPNAGFIGFGWGDAAYFPEPDPGITTLLNAAFQPTPSVVHVTGLSSHPRDAFSKDEVIRLRLSAGGFRKLLEFLYAAFDRGGVARATVYAPGLHSYSKFYRAQGEFHLLNNCNSWTARGIAAAGLPLDPDMIFRAESLMASLREIAK